MTEVEGAKSHPLSPEGRSSALATMASAPLDLLVVGGGITGAGVARDAALRGMRVGLIEKADFASGTSSRSSKIIHGGVRYLEYLQFGLVHESARERTVLRAIAPHLVHELPFLYPVFAGESLLKVRMGLKLFDAFAESPPGERSRGISPDETRSFLPGLREPLKGSVIYPEFITDDARFTLANVASAAERGALVANHVRLDSFLVRDGRVVGGRVTDRVTGAELEIRAEVTVSAVGPWAQQILEANDFRLPKPLIPSKGIHILLRRERLPLRAATFLRAPGGRRGLAMPRGPWVYVGTSDDQYTGDLDLARADATEVTELLRMTQECFPGAELGPADVRGSWAGVRPLIKEPGRSTRDTSRHDEVWISTPGLVTVAGGKLTTYRPMSRRILAKVAEARGRPLPGEDSTARVLLPGAPREGVEAMRSRQREELTGHGVPGGVRDRLEFLYGTEIDALLAYSKEDPRWLDPLGEGVPALRGEVRLAVERGMAHTLADVMDRRLALLLFAEEGGWPGAGAAAAVMGARLGWDREREEKELLAYRTLVRDHGPPLPGPTERGVAGLVH